MVMARYQGRYQANLLKNPKLIFLAAVVLLFFILYTSNSKPSKPKSTQKTKAKPENNIPFLLTPSSYGYKNFTEFIPGHLPLIISIPHGGHLFPDEIPDRKQNIPGIVKSNDINTQEIGHLLSTRIMQRLEGRGPYIIINHLGRSKIDVNRPLEEGVEIESSNDTQIAWNDYHNFIRDAIDEVELRYGHGLLIDIHGHGHPENYIELGYVLSSTALSVSSETLTNDKEIASESSIRALYTRNQNTLSFSELLIGEDTSLGGKLQNLGYDTIPSNIHKYPMPNERYFHGGYSVQKYGSRHNEQVVDAIQIELPRLLRLGNRKLRERFVSDFAEALVWYIGKYYLPENSENPENQD